MNTENQRLRDMLSQVTNNYNALQMHIIALMQQQQENRRAPESNQAHEVIIDYPFIYINLFKSLINMLIFFNLI